MRDILFVGALGLGMRSLLQLAIDQKPKAFRNVLGSDHNSCDASRKEFGEQVQWVDPSLTTAQIRKQFAIDHLTVVYSTAIPKEHPQRAKDPQCTFLHRAQFLAQLTEEKELIAVMGTHGKTSTTAVLTTLLAELNPSFYCGESFYAAQHAKKMRSFWSSQPPFVSEVDESDGSFTHLTPKWLILTNFDGDHFELWDKEGRRLALHSSEREFYNTLQAKSSEKTPEKTPEKSPGQVQVEVLAHFLKRVQPKVIWSADCPVLQKLIPSLDLKKSPISYGFSQSADIPIFRPSPSGEVERFSLRAAGWEKITWSLNTLNSGLRGLHQISNVSAACIIAYHFGIQPEALQKQLLLLRGVDRRMERLYSSIAPSANEKVRVIFDDYAHHPLEIKSTLAAFLENPGPFAKQSVTVVFEPHRYERLMHCYRDFCSSFQGAERVYLIPAFQPKGRSASQEIDLEKMSGDIAKGSEVVCLSTRCLE